MGMTYVQKVLAKACGKTSVAVGDVIEPAVHLAMSHENGALVINQFLEIYKGTGIEANVWDPSRIAIIFDHRVPAESSKTATNQKKAARIRRQTGDHQIPRYPRRRGRHLPSDSAGVRLCPARDGCSRHRQPHHQPRCAWARSRSVSAPPRWPRSGRWATSSMSRCPARSRSSPPAKFAPYVGAKDLILHLIGKITAEGANFKVLEFHGEAITNMSTSGRLTVCNMSVEAGATSGIVPPDEETLNYLKNVAGVKDKIEILRARSGRSLRAGHRYRCLQARPADRLPAHGRQYQAGRGAVAARRSIRS